MSTTTREQLLDLSTDELSARIEDGRRFLAENYYGQLAKESTASVARTEGMALGAETIRALDLQDQAWQGYASALLTTITGGNTFENLQIVTVPSEVHWDDPEFGDYYFHKVIADLMNDNGGTYRKGAGSFSGRYGDFLHDVLVPPVDEDALTKSRTALLDAAEDEQRHADLVYNIQLEWQAFDDRQTSSLPPARWMTVETWYERFRKNRLIEASSEIVLAYYAKYFQLIQRAFGGGHAITRALSDYTNASLLDVTPPRLGTTRPAGKDDSIYPYQISVDYPTWLADAKAGRHQRVRFNINRNTSSYDYSNTSIGGGIGIGFGFFGIIAGGSRNTVQIDSTSSSFNLRFEADLQTFEITPGRWYNSGALSLFADGPFVSGSPIDAKARAGTLFGPKGYLNFRPARAIVAYKPVVTVQLSRTEYHYFRQVTSGAAAFCVGPFVVGVGGYYDVRESVRWDDQNFTLTLFNAPEAPHLLAFDSQPLPA